MSYPRGLGSSMFDLSFRNLSIRRKLMAIAMITSGVVLFLACSSFVIDEVVTFKSVEKEKLSAIAEIVGNQSTAALIYNDAKTAKEILSALKAEPEIDYAGILDEKGELFVEYKQSGAKTSPPLPIGPIGAEESYRFDGAFLILSKKVNLDSQAIGRVILVSNLQGLYGRLKGSASIWILVLFFSFLIAFRLASKLEKVISDPIYKLAAAERIVSSEKNYGVRVEKDGNDEVGSLIDGFNEMLVEIQKSDAELQGHLDHLEETVAYLTQQLTHMNLL